MGYVRGIEKKTNEISAGARTIVAGVKEQERTNKAAVAEIGKGVAAVQTGIKETAREIDAGVKKIHSNINTLLNQTKAYTKSFWFGGAVAKE